MASIWLICLLTLTGLNLIYAQDSTAEETDIQPYLLLANTFDIRRLNFDGTGYRFLTGGLSGTVAMDYDYTTGYMYWSHNDGQNKKISRAPLETGTPVEDIVTTNLGEPDGIAIDWVNRKLFWTDGALNLIEKANLDGTQRGVLISSGIHKPRGIALDPHADYMYFTDVSDTAPSIQKARMSDGYYREIIITGGLERPNALAIDYEQSRLYFADAHTDRIESCTLDGNDRRLIIDRPSTFHPYGLSVYQDRLYWSDVLQHHIMHVDKATGINRVKMEGYFAYPTALHVVHPSRQLLQNRDWCEANDGLGPCQHVCRNTYGGYECICLAGYEQLDNDQHGCQDINECSNSNGGCNHQCVNTEGGFQCECIGGFGLLPDSLTCADLNECHTDNGGCQYTCHNTHTGYYCSCPAGLMLTADQHQCTDMNECLQHPCPADGYCANVIGSYTCHCSQGYQYSAISNTCQDIDECVSGQSRCSQLCVNQPATYRCECHSGFVLPADGVSCVDINECQLNTDGCDQRCTNVMGSYICSCQEGFLLSSDGHTCTVINCNQPASIPGFSLSCHGNNYGNTCSLSCEQGQLIGNPVITCLSSSQWSIATAECITSTVTPGDENEPPIRVYLSSNTIPEDAVIGSVIGTINAIDSNPTQTFTFGLVSAANTFYINQEDDTLRTKVPLNFESTSTFSVSITAIDSGTPPLSVTSDLTILVLDINEQPSPPSITNMYVSEHTQPGGTVGQLQASDPDTDQVMTFALLSSANGKFDLDGDMIIVAGKINFESKHIHYITVLVTDSGQPAQTNTATLTIQLYDRNDSPTDIYLMPDTIPEATADSGTSSGTVIGELSTEDEDTWDSHTYTVSGDNSACFVISESTLLVQDKSCFDFEASPTVEVTVISTDTGLKTVQRTLHVKLTDAEEAPTAIVLSSGVIREHSELNTVVGVLTAMDPDQGDTHMFFVGSHDSNVFRIEGNKLVVHSDVSYNNHQSGIVLGLAASDRSGKVLSQNYAIHILDINEPPGEITWHIEQNCVEDHSSEDGLEVQACVEEERSTGAVIARPSVIDPDGDQLTWTILDSSGGFNIEVDGTVRVSSKRLSYEDFEKISHGSVQSVVIVATDPDGYSTSSQLNIKVLDINDAPRRVLISNAWIASNTPIGQTVATLTCDDQDPDDQHTFAFVYPVTYFNIVGNQIQVNADLQGLVGSHITTYIVCSDGVLVTAPGYIVMNVIDTGQTNDISLTLDPNYVIENSPADQVIGTVRALSPTAPLDSYTFSLPAIFQEQFGLSTTTEVNAINLIAPWPFDYESVSTLDVVVQAVTGNNTVMQHFTINVLNVNEPPENITLTGMSVPENKIAALAGIVSAMDPEADDMDFEIVDDPANAFQLTQHGIANTRQLITTRKLDYESEPTLTITISVTDSAGSGQSTTRTFQITVSNINEAPSRIQPIRFKVEENTDAMTTVGMLVVTDVDDVHTPQRIECHMKDDGGGLFVISGTDIQVADGVLLDFESFPINRKTITVTVECYDQGQLSSSADIDMVITDINEAPTDIVSQTGVFEIEENNIGGSILATLLTIDPETPEPAAGHFTYTTTSPLTFPFAIIGDRIIVHQSLNYEERTFYDMDITTMDSGGMTVTKKIKINVLDGNDAPTAIVMATTAKIFEHSTPATPICTLTAIDEDVDQEHFFVIESQTPEGALQIFNGTQLLVGDTDIDYESTDRVSVTIKVRDIGMTQPGLFVDTFSLEVIDVNESPTGIQLSASTVIENPAVGTPVGQILVDDPDLFDQTFYCYLGYDGTSNFQLANRGNEIWLQVGYDASSFNYEHTQSVTVTLWCRDSNPEYFAQGVFTVQIEDANDPPTGLVFMDAAERTATTNASQPAGPNIVGSVVTSQTVTIREDAPASVGVVCYIFILDEDAFSGAEPAHQSAVVELISQDEYDTIMGSSGRRRRSTDRIYSRSRRQAANDPSKTSDDFVIQSGTNYLLVNNKLDHETKAEYLVYFKAYDPDIPEMIVTSSLRVVVLDIDEAPQDMALTSTIVAENSPVNTKIGDLSVTDPDGTKTGYVYTMISLGTPFYVIGTSLHVERHPLDYEVTPAISIQIHVKEIATTLICTKTFHINVTDVPEAPTSLTINGNITVWVPETMATTTSLGTIMADDPDQNDGEMTFTFFKQQPTEFQIVGDQLMLVDNLDSWERRLFDLPMQVADNTGLTFRQVIFVRVMEEDRCQEENYCSLFATCVHNTCQCKPGFVGDGINCIDHNECVPNPCDTKNSYGACENGIGGLRNFTCQCRSGWTGPECTNRVNECDNNLCHEQGTLECKDMDNGYACVCRDGFTGTYCDINGDDCIDHKCQNGGMCVDGINGYMCDCPEPYVGLLCETNSDLCTGVICPYNGTCLPVPNESTTVCRCLEPYAADCQGCAYGYGGPDCLPCKSPYTGENCLVDSTVCYGNPCEGQKICVPYYKQYACICPANETVSNCEGTINQIIMHDRQVNWVQTTGGLSSLVVAAVALLALIVLLLALLYCRKLRHKPRPWSRARFNSESQQVIIDNQEIGISDNPGWPSHYPTSGHPVSQRNPKNNIKSVKVSNDLRETGNPPRASVDGDQAVADFVGTIAKPLSSRGRHISSAKKNNLGEWEKGDLAYNGSDKFDGLKTDKEENLYVDMPQRELPIGAVVYKSDQYMPAQVSPTRHKPNPSSRRNSPRRQTGNHGVAGIEDSIATDNRHLQQSNKNTKKQMADSLKDNPVFQGSDDEDEVPTSII